ncbi:MAG: anthranilate synthase component 1 [Permianibacter sp.]
MAAVPVQSANAAAANVRADYRVLSRQFTLSAAPVDLFASQTDDGRAEGHFLLETVDNVVPAYGAPTTQAGKSLLLLSPCLKLHGKGRHVTLTALTVNGRALLKKLIAALLAASAVQTQSQRDEQVTLRFPRPEAGVDELARLRAASPFDVLRAVLTALMPSSADVSKALLLTGVFPFESIELFEQFAPFADGTDSDSFTLYVPEILVQVPRDGHPAQATALVIDGEQSERVENELSRRLALLAEQAGKLKTVQAPAPVAALEPVTTNVSDSAFCAQVRQVQEHLRAGDAFQIVISRRFQLPCHAPLTAYRALRQENPSPYLFYGATDAFTLFGASPESAVKVDGASRVLEVCPIAGTRPRGRDKNGALDLDRDARIEAELRADGKEVAEHMMLVDLARNDVARICQPGSRRIKQLLTVERYARVMHLVSRVNGVLKPELDALHAFAASMPMGTLSGAPKIRAIQIIRAIERAPRGCYGGAVGYLDAAGNMDTAIVIRAAVVRDGVATVQAGAGIVLGSEPQAEADETRRKAESVLRAIASANVSEKGA